MNALRHGLRARKVVIPGEMQDEFDQLHAGLQDQYQPQNPAEQHLVDQAAIAQWKLVRAEVFEAKCYAEKPSAEAQAAIFGRMTQFQCRLERAYFKVRKEGKAGKKDKYEHPPKLQVTSVNPETGEREVLFRSEYGKPVKEFSDASPSSSPPDPLCAEPTIPPG